MKESRRGRRGMTLMELLIVIVIIGVLVALLLPATVKMRKHAAEVKEKGMRVTLINGVLNFHTEYGEWPVADPPVAAPKDYPSSLVITELRADGTLNKRQKNFWEGDDQVNSMGGQEYYVRINPLGMYPIGEIDETDPKYAVSVHLK